ncbi:MAG TPA: hypothetical protein VJH23_05895 [archaeon]|nr:hypothetical protein [archaeon]
MERKLNISNMPQGHGIDEATIRNLLERAYDKLNDRMHGELLMDVHFKEFHKTGAKEEVETKVKAVVAGFQFHADARDWSAEKSVKTALAAIEKEAQRAIAKKKER